MSDSNGSFALAKAVHAALSVDVILQSFLGQTPRLYDQSPEDPIFPYLSYGGIKSENISGDMAPLYAHTMSLHIWSRYGGRAEVLQIIDAVCAVLNANNLVLNTASLVSTRIVFTDVFRAADGHTLHGVIRLHAITQP